MNENENNTAPDVMEHFARLSRMVRRRPTKKDRRLSHGWARLLAVVMEEDGIRASELANRLDIRPSSLSELLKKMEEEGYFLRVRDESDSRVVHIHATDKGREEYERRGTERQDFSSLLRAGLTDEEAGAFCALCDKLCAHLEKEFPPEAQAAMQHPGHRGAHGGYGRGKGPGGHARQGDPGAGPTDHADPDGENRGRREGRARPEAKPDSGSRAAKPGRRGGHHRHSGEVQP